MNDKKLKQILKQGAPKPSSTWKARMNNMFKELSESDVTNTLNPRKNLYTLFNLNLSFMEGKTKLLIGVVVGVVTFIGLGVGTAYASDAAVPGDLLYPLDKGMESLERSVTTDPVKLAELELEILNERVEELKKLQEDGSVDDINLALDEISEQQDKTSERVREVERLNQNEEVPDTARQEVTNRYENSVGDTYQYMNQIATEDKNQGEETQQRIEENKVKLQQGNQDTEEDSDEDEDSEESETESEGESEAPGNQSPGR